MSAAGTPERRWQRNANPMPADQTRSYRVVASYGSYPEAERAVDYLSDQGFPVHQVAVVGRGLRSVEQVTGRLTYWSAAGRSALGGAIIGALIGWLFGLLDLVAPLVTSIVLALSGALLGAVVGAIVGALAHAMTGGRRDFSSVTGIQADTYDVQADAETADQAVAILTRADGPGLGSLSTT